MPTLQQLGRQFRPRPGGALDSTGVHVTHKAVHTWAARCGPLAMGAGQGLVVVGQGLGGVIVVDLEDKDPDELMMDALDAGADDFDAGEDAAEVGALPEICDALEKKGYKFISADVAQVPSTTTVLTDPIVDRVRAMDLEIDPPPSTRDEDGKCIAVTKEQA